MSKAIVLFLTSLSISAFASVRPSYAETTINAFLSEVKKSKSTAEKWQSYEALLAKLSSEKIEIKNPDQLIYMNSLMIAFEEINKADVMARKCKKILSNLDEKFLVKGMSVSKGPRHYQDARIILLSICQ